MKTITVLLLICITSALYAQPKTNWGFMSGTIRLHTGDSINCLIEKQVAYDQTLLYKMSNNEKIEELPINKIKYFVAGNKCFESVPLYNSFQLMEVLDTGKMALYTFNEIKYQPTKRSAATGNRITKGDILVHYVINKAGTIQEIKEPTFKIVLKQLFSDCERMGGKVFRGDYLFEDMPQIIRDFNNCKGQYCEHTASASATN